MTSLATMLPTCLSASLAASLTAGLTTGLTTSFAGMTRFVALMAVRFSANRESCAEV